VARPAEAGRGLDVALALVGVHAGGDHHGVARLKALGDGGVEQLDRLRVHVLLGHTAGEQVAHLLQ
jgi:hypothetical protein